MPGRATPAAARVPVLARLRVGTKLLLLVLLPLCGLLALTAIATLENRRDAARLREFRAAAQLSFSVAAVAQAVEVEGIQAVIDRVRPDPTAGGELGSARRRLDAALRTAVDRSAGHEGPVDVAGRLDAVGRQIQALRLQAGAGAMTGDAIADGYGVVARNAIGIATDLDTGRPARASGRAADAYVALLRASDAAARERAALTTLIGAPRGRTPSSRLPWATLESAELDIFRQNATGRLNADLEALLFAAPGRTVSAIRERFARDPRRTVEATSLQRWLDVSGERNAALLALERGARRDLSAAASRELGAAQTRVTRELGISLAILVAVAALAMALRRSITRPLQEVSEGAHMLSRGDLGFGVSYVGHDEIGDVANAFRNLRATAGGVAREIRTMNVAIGDNRLDHRADAGMFDGVWAQLLSGMNDTIATFADLQERRRAAESEAARFFNGSLDLLCIRGTDGYFKRVNPAFERTLGYSADELLSRPFLDFVHPDDRERTRGALAELTRGDAVVQFENRYLHRDGSVRWLQWSSLLVREEGLVYAAARDVTESRRSREEQAALRHVATLVAEVAPAEVLFSSVAEAVARLLGARSAQVVRDEPDGSATILASAPAESDAEGDAATGSMRAPIVVEDRVWGAIVVTFPEAEPPRPATEERLTRFTQLVATAIANTESRTQLAASRARVVRAGDEARRRIQRDLHDGAQQRFVNTILALELARRALDGVAGEGPQLVDEALANAERANQQLRELASGIHPTVLTIGGLGAALETLAQESPLPMTLEMNTDARLPDLVEVTAYFVVSEALTNAAKHARATSVRVTLDLAGGDVQVSISDDGVGGADPARGSGLVGLKDRVEAAGGTLTVDSRPGRGTQVVAKVPVDADRAASHTDPPVAH
jgi:PAS domain S-box-containing protein